MKKALAALTTVAAALTACGGSKAEVFDTPKQACQSVEGGVGFQVLEHPTPTLRTWRRCASTAKGNAIASFTNKPVGGWHLIENDR